MAQDYVYPTKERIIELNALSLNRIKAKKSDAHKILSVSKISECIEKCKLCKGDIYDKAAVLLELLIKVHAFASANRRTAFITAKYFLMTNHARFGIKNESLNARALLGIREGYYETKEIKEWLKSGIIREFIR